MPVGHITGRVSTMTTEPQPYNPHIESSPAPVPEGLTGPEMADLMAALDQARVRANDTVALAQRATNDNPAKGAATLHRAHQRLAAVQGAYQRLTDGHYNTCVGCSGQIGAARLIALPQSDRCVTCAQTTPQKQ